MTGLSQSGSWIKDAPVRLSAGLDLADGDDRAIFRQRVWRFYRDTRLSFVQREAHEMGLRAPADRASLMRLIADHWMRALKEGVGLQPRTSESDSRI